MKRQKRTLTILIIVLVAAIISATVVYFWPSQTPFPEAVIKQTNFAVFVPNSKKIIIDTASIKYNPNEKLLAYTVTIDKTTAVISEQATPDQFVDIPAVYDKFLESFNQYKTFEVPAGKIYLGHPPNLPGKQAAVMNSKGTLVFVKPSYDLADEQWRSLFLSLETRK